MSTSRPPGPRTLAVVLAAIDARATVAACVARWLEVLDGRDDLIVVVADGDGTAELVEGSFPGVRVLRRPTGRLAPELWREGLDASDADLVAFSTAQMLPADGWRGAMLGRLEATGAAAVGGPIEPAAGLPPTDRAVYLLRHVHYLRPLPPVESDRVEPPGDNAVYRRECLEGLESLWSGGFWEVEIHRALRRGGHRLAMAEEAAVAFRGGSRLVSFLRQRYAHARRYGASRAGDWSTASRLARLAATPVVPVVLLRRIFAALSARGQAPARWLPAVPALLSMLSAWSIGEARGVIEGFREVPLLNQLPPGEGARRAGVGWEPGVRGRGMEIPFWGRVRQGRSKACRRRPPRPSPDLHPLTPIPHPPSGHPLPR